MVPEIKTLIASISGRPLIGSRSSYRVMENILWPLEEDLATCKLPKDCGEGKCIGHRVGGF